MEYRTDDLRIREIKELLTPSEVLRDFPITRNAAKTVYETRQAIHRILHGADDRLLVVMGPCSIHDVRAAKDYAGKLHDAKDRLATDLLVVMRVYFEKPRTTVGWKGLINDPKLNGSFHINEGLQLARHLLLELNESGMAAGSEFLDMITPQYLADLVSWGAIGARTTESQVHRELASGLSCPVGFKNGTNEDCHVILRGGKQPNYDAITVNSAAKALAEAGIPARIMIDFSHGNSGKEPQNQVAVGREVASQIADGDERIFGVMIESHLKAGRQDLLPGKELVYGLSITDACVGWDDSRALLDTLADAVRRRRLKAEAEAETE